MRIDKWLWYSRFFKTRSLAVKAVRGGKIHINCVRAKPAREVSVGIFLKVQRGELVSEVKILKIPDRRGPAIEAMTLYEETIESIKQRETALERISSAPRIFPPTIGRPDKRTRRLLNYRQYR